jgi:hypothetical protein
VAAEQIAKGAAFVFRLQRAIGLKVVAKLMVLAGLPGSGISSVG